MSTSEATQLSPMEWVLHGKRMIVDNVKKGKLIVTVHVTTKELVGDFNPVLHKCMGHNFGLFYISHDPMPSSVHEELFTASSLHPKLQTLVNQFPTMQALKTTLAVAD
jgi:hypothetical protein